MQIHIVDKLNSQKTQVQHMNDTSRVQMKDVYKLTTCWLQIHAADKSDQISDFTYVVFIEVRVDFQLVSPHSALEWIKHRPLWNASGGEHRCDLFS